MEKGKRLILILVVLVIIILIGVLVLSKSKEKPKVINEPVTEPVEEAVTEDLYEKYKDLQGQWKGEWKNTTFGSTGGASLELTIEKDGRAKFVIDLDGFVFGLLNPGPKTFEGTFNDNGAVFKADRDDLFGDMTITISPQGDIDVRGLNVPVARVDALTATGTMTLEEVKLDYTVNFPAGDFAKGVFSLTKQK